MADWAGDFGNEYTERNVELPDRRQFWAQILNTYKPLTILEVGANRGFNLTWISEIIGRYPDIRLWATDINAIALSALREQCEYINTVYGDARDLPFKDGLFDLVFTVGVLIHIPPADVPKAIQEIVRVSRRHILLCEYENSDILEVVYRGRHKALWKAPFGQIAEQSAALTPVDSGFLTKNDGFDRVTWWLYEKGRNSPSKTQ